jgi:DHA1 family inner membrane transport protein
VLLGGRLALDHGFGYEWPSRVGAVLALAGLAIALLSGRLESASAARRGCTVPELAAG